MPFSLALSKDTAVTAARAVFATAAVTGIAVLIPQLIDEDGKERDVHPGLSRAPLFYYSFHTVALTWQLVFGVIASDPMQYRALIPLAVLEKLSFVIPGIVLIRAGRVPATYPRAAFIMDGTLGLLFALSYILTAPKALKAA